MTQPPVTGQRGDQANERSIASRKNLVSDFTAGLTTGIADIPDAMASAILAGANPVQGLYAIMIGTPLGAIFGSSAFMTVAATSAVAITAGSALTAFSGEERATALAGLALLAGLFMVLAGLLKAGRLLRFVSNSVVIGFLTGVSILVVLSQLGDLTGYSSAYSNKVMKTIDLLRNLDQIDPPTAVIGLLTILIILAVNKTRLANFSMLIGMLGGSALLLLLGWASVQQVSDVATIPTSLPMPKLPDPSQWPILIVDAVAIAVIAMVQGAGVSKAYPNPDGNYPEASRDFIGQGAANIGAGLLQGMPVGGSVSTTALNVSSGARSRWANILSGLVVVVAVLLFSRAVSLVAMPAMAALLIVAGVQSLKREEIADVWHTGWGSRTVMLATLGLTLFIPLQWAVFAGAALSILFYLVSSSEEARVVEYVANPDGTFTEKAPPAVLPSHAVTLLQVYGSLFFAGAGHVEAMLPSAKGAERPVVVMRLRFQDSISSTFINILERYAAELRESGGRLFLTGVSEKVKQQLDRTRTTEEVLGGDSIFLATNTLGAASRQAMLAADGWLQATVGGAILQMEELNTDKSQIQTD
jgi:SulP family sulfate permease